MSKRGEARHRLRLLLVTLVLGLVAAGTAAAAAPTKARARAVARAVNLVAADLPAFTASAAGPTTATDKRLGASVARCAGAASPGREIVNLDSPDFSLKSPGAIAEEDISSNVTVLTSRRLVAQDLRAVRSQRGRSCVTAAVNRLVHSLKTPGVTFGRVSVRRGRPQDTGADGSFALRFKITAKAKGVKIPFYVDTLGFTLGRAEVGLSAIGILHPVAAATEQGLFTLLLERAMANRL